MTDYGVNEYKIVRYRNFADLRDLTYVVQASGGPIDGREFKNHIHPDTDASYDVGHAGKVIRHLVATSGTFDEAVINGVAHSTIPPIAYGIQASGYVNLINSVSGTINFVGTSGISVVNNGDGTFDIGYEPSGGAGVTSINTLGGALTFVGVSGVSISDDGLSVITISQADISFTPVDARAVTGHIIPDTTATYDLGTASLLFRRVDATSGVFTNIGGHSAINVMDDLKTDRWLSQDSNTILGVGAAGGGNLEHTTGDEGYFNVLLGNKAGYSITKAKGSVAIGYEALYKNLTGASNMAIGCHTLYNNTTGDSNTAIGWFALAANIGGHNNTGIGTFALVSNTTGTYNIAMGRDSLYSNVGGHYNVAIGWEAAKYNTEGDDNVVIGRYALRRSITGKENVAIGFCALQSNITGNNNMALGPYCMQLSTAGNFNTGVGRATLNAFPDDAGNAVSFDNTDVNIETDCVTVTGHGLGDDDTRLMLRFTEGTSSVPGLTDDGIYRVQIIDEDTVYFYETNITGQGSGTGHTLTPQLTLTYATAIGTGADVDGSNQVQLGDSSSTTYAYGAVQDRSDARDKADIQDSDLGLAFINKVRPVRFVRDYREDYIEQVIDENAREKNGYIHDRIVFKKDGSRKRTRPHYGLVAQEVKSVLDELDVDFGGYQDHSIKGGSDVLTLGYSEFIAPMIKAIQELSAKVDALEKQIKDK